MSLDYSNIDLQKQKKVSFKIILAGMIGNGLEFYDFALFGVFSGIFANIFFEKSDFSSLLKSLSFFAVGFLMRPLGAIFFGYIGDRYGRKKSLTLSITLMGIATFLIGCLPTYTEIGIYAPLGLLFCRLAQGFCLGGENNGSAIFVLEHSKQNQKGLIGALILTGGAIGTLLAMFLGAFVMLPSMPHWGWRIPFWLGLMIGLIGLYIRQNLDETPEYKRVILDNSIVKFPLKAILKTNFQYFLIIIGIGGVNGIFAYTLVVFVNLYMNKTLGLSASQSMFNSCIGLVFFAVLSPIFGILADRYGAIRIMKIGCLYSCIISFPLFYLLHNYIVFPFTITVFMAALTMASFNAPSNALLNKILPVNLRYSGISLGYAIGAALFGGTAPLIYIFLLESTGNVYSPALYLMFAALVGLSSLLFLQKLNSKA